MSGTAKASRVEIGLAIGLGAAVLWLGMGVVRLGLYKDYAIDEFQYAHAAWLFAQGVLPYRDYFEVHHPLLYQLLSLVWIGSDDPLRIGAMRVFMLGVVGAILWAAWRVNAEDGRARALFAPLFFLAILPLTQRATEVRNDPLAFALFLCALAVLYLRIGAHARAYASGALLALACWGSQKVFVYGSVFLAALLADLVWNRRAARGYLLGDPLRFLGGALGVALPVALYLSFSGSWGAWWRWCFVWAWEHETGYEAFSWFRYMQPVLLSYWWAFGLAGVGVAATWRKLLALGESARLHPDQLLLASLASSFVSLAAQQAPYPYSFIPFLALVAVFAARGVNAGVRRVQALSVAGRLSAPFFTIAGGLLLALLLVRSAGHVETRLERSNTYQRQVLAKIGELTAPEDAAYDNSGGFISRPHTHFYFYSDNVIRERESGRLLREVPLEVERRGTVLFLHDLRFKYLPARLREFFTRNYQRYNADIWLWGQRYEAGSGSLTGRFSAVREGRYFVEPPDALERGRLWIDGAPLGGPVFELSRGSHQIRYQGEPGGFWILWLPRNGERYTPQSGGVPAFSQFL